jgi:hypothetical protein
LNLLLRRRPAAPEAGQATISEKIEIIVKRQRAVAEIKKDSKHKPWPL